MNAIKLMIASLEKTIPGLLSNKTDTADSDDTIKNKAQTADIVKQSDITKYSNVSNSNNTIKSKPNLADRVKQSDITQSSNVTVTQDKDLADTESKGNNCIMKLKENKKSKNAKKANQ